MIDFVILEQMTAFAVIMQKHPGWVGESTAQSPSVLEEFYLFFILSFCLSPLFFAMLYLLFGNQLYLVPYYPPTNFAKHLTLYYGLCMA